MSKQKEVKYMQEKKVNLVKNTVADSVFSDLFSDSKYLLKLYQALHPEDKETTEADITDATIENIIVNDIYNDLGFMVGGRLMILIEAQSSWTENITIRLLLYLAKTYGRLFAERGSDLYGGKKVELPEPELYVVYTGDRKGRPGKMSLSDAFFGGRKSSLDLEVRFLYGDSQDIVGEYVRFVRVIKEQEKLYGRTREAVVNAIKICKDEKVLTEYLETREKEVQDIMTIVFDNEELIRIHEKAVEKEAIERGLAEGMERGMAEGMAQGMAEGLSQGKELGKETLAEALLSLGVSEQLISQARALAAGRIEE